MAEVLGFGENYDYSRNHWQLQDDHVQLTQYTLKLEERMEDTRLEVQCLKAIIGTILQATLRIPDLPPALSSALHGKALTGGFSKRHLYWHMSDYTKPIMTQSLVSVGGTLRYDARPMEFIVDVYGRPWTHTQDFLSWLQRYLDQAANEGRIGDLRSEIATPESLPRAFVEAAAVEAEKAFPELKLCHDHWKFRAAAASFIPAWKRHREVVLMNRKRRMEEVEAEMTARKRQKIDGAASIGASTALVNPSGTQVIVPDHLTQWVTVPQDGHNKVISNVSQPPSPVTPVSTNSPNHLEHETIQSNGSAPSGAPPTHGTATTKPNTSTNNTSIHPTNDIAASNSASETTLNAESSSTAAPQKDLSNVDELVSATAPPIVATVPDTVYPITTVPLTTAPTCAPLLSASAPQPSCHQHPDTQDNPLRQLDNTSSVPVNVAPRRPKRILVEHCKQRWLLDPGNRNKTRNDANNWWRTLNKVQKRAYKTETFVEFVVNAPPR